MADASSSYDARPEDGWGPATPVRSASTAARTSAAQQGGPNDTPTRHPRRTPGGEPTPAVRTNSATSSAGPVGSAWDRLAAVGQPSNQANERGLPGWGALLVLVGIAAVGGLIDMISGTQVRGGFNIGIVLASIVAILLVRRSAMFPIVIAPPIVYSLASGLMLYVRSNGLNDHRVLIDSAANWLVYGFPAVAAATAAVLIIAGARLILRK